MPTPGVKIEELKGIGKSRAASFRKLGVERLRDLLDFFPRAYEDRRFVQRISSLRDADNALIKATVITEPALQRLGGGKTRLHFSVSDESGRAEISFFNAPYLVNKIRIGTELYFFGKPKQLGARFFFTNPDFEQVGEDSAEMRKILPIYRLSKGLTQKIVRKTAETAIMAASAYIKSFLPPSIVEREGLCSLRFAYENIHFPADEEALSRARRRLVFDELFLFSACINFMRAKRGREKGQKLEKTDFSEFFASLPFEPTDSQKQAIADCAEDLSSGSLMTRLIIGDVGSGKTLVAAAVALMTAKNGGQTAYMAPTEILALQHYESMKGFLEPFGIKVALLRGGMPLKERAETEERIKKGEVQVICGTHALISGSTQYKNLLLAITDEQHRFGVSQRSELSEKGESAHILAMSATPIPRTLALTLYGDLEVSFMRDMPKGRQKIDTFVVGESYRERINRFMEKQVTQGRQVYVVCPMIEEGEEESGLISAEERSEKLKKRFPELKVGLLHGRLPSKEKGEAIKSFRQGDIDILVSTTVIEVGVDSPNASLIVVENAERFGLSQLHQLRGRVGRGRHKSYCILMSAGDSGVARERLDVMSKTNDGFLIAEEDLRLRGPGDFFGKRQHGLPEMHIADLGADMEVLKRVADYSGELFSKDPDLKLPEHRDLKLKIKEVFQESLSLS